MSNGTDRRQARGLAPTPAERARSLSADAARYQGLANQSAMDTRRRLLARTSFDPLKVDWKSEGSGSRAAPFNPLNVQWEQEGGGSRSSGVDVEALRAARLGAEATSALDALPTPDDEPSSKPEVPDYPEEGSALSAEVFGALAERRRVVDEQLQKAMEQERFQSQRLQLAANTARTQVAREFRNLAEDLQMKLGGRGLATDPRFSGRGRRRLQMQQDEKFGEISQTLADEISALQEMVQTVSDARDREMAKIAQDEALARTNPSALLPAALQYSE